MEFTLEDEHFPTGVTVLKGSIQHLPRKETTWANTYGNTAPQGPYSMWRDSFTMCGGNTDAAGDGELVEHGLSCHVAYRHDYMDEQKQAVAHSC